MNQKRTYLLLVVFCCFSIVYTLCIQSQKQVELYTLNSNITWNTNYNKSLFQRKMEGLFSEDIIVFYYEEAKKENLDPYFLVACTLFEYYGAPRQITPLTPNGLFSKETQMEIIHSIATEFSQTTPSYRYYGRTTLQEVGQSLSPATIPDHSLDTAKNLLQYMNDLKTRDQLF